MDEYKSPIGEVKSCSIIFPKITADFIKSMPVQYEYILSLVYIDIYKKALSPTKFHLPTKEGLRVDCVPIDTVEQCNFETEKLLTYLEYIKEKYMKIKQEEKNNDELHNSD